MSDSRNDDAQPLKGVVLCSTSLSQDHRTLLGHIASDMGAIHRLDLTADVTHLVVGNIDTPKYKHTAKERPDIHVLQPDWIHAVRKAWTEGQDVDIEALFQEYRLPALYNLYVCVTGFEDIDQRQALISQISDNGAKYKGDLTKLVTHLVVAKPKGAKYERAKAWNINIVSLRWLEDSLQRGMALDESLYHPLMPLDDQGQGAFIRTYQRTQPLGKRRREDVQEDTGKRRLRRTASTRLGNHSQHLLTDISFAEDDHSGSLNDQWTDGKDDQAVHLSISRDNTPSVSGNNISRPASRPSGPPVLEERGLFSKSLCLVHGHDEKRTSKIIQVVSSNGGQTTRSPEDLFSALDSNTCERAVIIVPSEWTSVAKDSMPAVPTGTWHVTEWWLERCIKQTSIINPEDDVLSRPHLDFPIDGFAELSIATSGMGQDVMHVARVVELAGASYHQDFTPKTSVLVTPSLTANAQKVRYAAKHKIPVVSENWLLLSIARAQILPLGDYAISAMPEEVSTKQQASHSTGREEAALPQRERRKDDSLVQRLSATRKRSLAPSLHLIKSGGVQHVHQAKPQPVNKLPFIEDEASSEDEQASLDQEATVLQEVQAYNQSTTQIDDTILKSRPSHNPLQELPPDMNSSRKKSDEQSPTESKVSATAHGEQVLVPVATSPPKSPSSEACKDLKNAHKAETDKSRLHGDIKSLLERKHTAPAPAEELLKGRRRKDRKLGRAPSLSNPSTPASFRQTTSMEVLDTAGPANLADVGLPMPSQQLTYETPDAEEYRAKMSKRMGTRLADDGIGTRVEGIGVVRDADSSTTGVGGRVRGRHRSAKNVE